MGNTRKKKTTLFEQKIEIVKKLMNMGIKTEKGLHTLSIEQLLNDDSSITADELRDILQVKQQVKAGTLFSWLCEEPDISSNFDEKHIDTNSVSI